MGGLRGINGAGLTSWEFFSCYGILHAMEKKKPAESSSIIVHLPINVCVCVCGIQFCDLLTQFLVLFDILFL